MIRMLLLLLMLLLPFSLLLLLLVCVDPGVEDTVERVEKPWQENRWQDGRNTIKANIKTECRIPEESDILLAGREPVVFSGMMAIALSTS
jgi:hypothetical protein